jgi:plastocyanin
MFNRGYLHISLVAMFAFALPAAKSADTGTIKGKVTIKNAKHNGNAVVYLEEVEVEGAERPSAKHKMWQKEKQFSPQVLVVQKGDEVEFPNGDKLFHNVFSVSRPSRFDLGLYQSGETKTVKFKRTGVVDVYCNIHPQMVAKILIVENKFFFETDKDGAFSLDGVPPGTYDLVAWHPHGEPVEQKVTVSAGGKVTVDLTVSTSDGSDTHTRKDGTPYGRYK